MTVYTQNNKILLNIAGEAYKTAPIIDISKTMNKILHIDTDLQLPNRIHKSDTDNKVRQITDKAQNIALVQTDPAKQPVYNYGGYYSFDGVNDVLYNPKMFYDFSKPNYTLFLLVRPTNLAKQQTIMACRANGGNTFFTLYQYNTTGLYSAQVRINGTTLYAANASVPLVVNQWNTIVLTVANNQASIIINGKMAGSAYGFTHSGFSIPYLTVAPTQIGNEFNRAGWFFAGDIAYIRMIQQDFPQWQQRNADNTTLQFNDGATVFNDAFLRNSGFTHFQRYPDNGTNKLYISSKYLKGAVIDSGNKVEKLYTYFRGVDGGAYAGQTLLHYMYEATLSKRPEVTKNGLKFTSSNNTILRTTNDGDRGISSGNYYYTYENLLSDICLMAWHTPQSLASHQCLLTLGDVQNNYIVRVFYNAMQNTGNRYLFYDNTNLSSIPDIYALGSYNHICTIRKNGIWYYFINGVLKNTSVPSNTSNPSIYVNLMIGGLPSMNYCDCLLDDVFVAHNNSIIDPTGFSVGQKVFEPPRRGEFEGTIKQY